MNKFAEYKLAVIIPVYKHSVFVAEAVHSALRQEDSPSNCILIIDDGCPFSETLYTCRSLSLAHANVFYFRKKNAGLSSARNYGINFVLKHFPTVEAMYFLDADNRLTPSALREVFDFLRKANSASWIYPNIDKIGIQWSGNFSGPYSKITHILWDNICEAGSLVRINVFKSGLRFDEEMLAGYEDWDFWLQALKAGFVGINFPYLGLEYRQRAESMITDSNREREAIRSYIRKKHRDLYQAKYLLALEEHEAPRYTFFTNNGTEFCSFTDPRTFALCRPLHFFIADYWRFMAEPDAFGVSPYFGWISSDQANILTEARIINSVLLNIERLCDQASFVRLKLLFSPEPVYSFCETHGVISAQAMDGITIGWFAKGETFQRCVVDSSDEWIRTLDDNEPQPHIITFSVTIPRGVQKSTVGHSASSLGVFSVLDQIKFAGLKMACGRWNWRSVCRPPMSDRYLLIRDSLRAAPMTNMSTQGSNINIAFIIPVGSYGGVEKVSYNIARQLSKAKYNCHLYVIGEPKFIRFDDLDDVFATINIFGGGYPLWVNGERYSGHALPDQNDASLQMQRVVGELACMDVVIASHVAPINAALGELRRRGAKVVGHFHVLDENKFGREVGHPYMGLAYEHVYDLLLTCSQNMSDFLHGMGVPKEKLMVIPNAPSFDTEGIDKQKLLNYRSSLRSSETISAVFVGRFDRQKGIEMLAKAISLGKNRNLAVRWRVIGSNVIDEALSIDWSIRLADLGIIVEKPIYAREDLIEVLVNADLLILPSRWEGAPLMILEAQRLGCVPIINAVGAVKELIESGTDGIIFQSEPDRDFAIQAADIIEQFSLDRNLLRLFSKAAINRAARASWSNSVNALSLKIGEWF